MRVKIIDEFTNLPISRQRKHQLRMKRDDYDKYVLIQRKYYSLDKLMNLKANLELRLSEIDRVIEIMTHKTSASA